MDDTDCNCLPFSEEYKRDSLLFNISDFGMRQAIKYLAQILQQTIFTHTHTHTHIYIYIYIYNMGRGSVVV
jgi:hypothetical protein